MEQHRDRTDDHTLDFGGGKAAIAAPRFRSVVPDSASFDIVAVPLSLLDCVGGGEWGSLVIEKEPRERARFPGIYALTPSHTIFTDPALHGIPGGLVDDGGMKPRIGILLMANLANVDWILEEVVKEPLSERFAAGFSAIRVDPNLGRNAEALGFYGRGPGIATLKVKGEQLADRLGLGLVDDQCLVLGVITKGDVSCGSQ